MVSNRCKTVVQDILNDMELHFILTDLGEVEVMEDVTGNLRQTLQSKLQQAGLELMDGKNAILIEKIKSAITQMVHFSDELPKTNYSDYLSDKLGYAYSYMSNVFSKVKGVTIQQFIIINRIEKVKELLRYDELNLTEISYKMQFSGVAHLSTQFKKVTGLTPTAFKNMKDNGRMSLEEIGALVQVDPGT
jgi:AraC-like DNA-binding protein